MTRPPILDPALADLTDSELALRRAEVETLGRAGLARYAVDALPLEREAVWRQRRDDPDHEVPLLFVTVGNQVDTPLMATLRWAAAKVVFLCTPTSKKHADEVVERLGLRASGVAIVDIGAAADPAELYRAVKEVWEAEGRPNGVVIDVTGGYKTMSTAAGLAAFMLPFARAAYVATRQDRLADGTWWLDTEVQRLPNPVEVFGDPQRRVAHTLMQAGRWAEAASQWEALYADVELGADGWRRDLCAGLAAIERLDAAGGAERLLALIETIGRHTRVDPRRRSDPLASDGALAALRTRAEAAAEVAEVLALGKKLDRSQFGHPNFPSALAFLWVQAETRRARGDLDVAALLAYRTMEGVAQRALAERGLDVTRMDWEAVARLAGEGNALPARREAKVDVGGAMEILVLLGSPLAAHQNAVKGRSESRNYSLLAHGLTTVSPKNVDEMLGTARTLLDELLGADEAARRIAAQRVVPSF